jgi:putative N6-adenine-specific DNA methylase
VIHTPATNSAFEKRIKRQVIGKPHRFQAVVPLGFEKTLAHELRSILKNGDSVKTPDTNSLPHVTGDGKVEFTAKITDAWKAVACSRIANRILMHIADFKAENFRDFEKKAAEIPWELYLDERTGSVQQAIDEKSNPTNSNNVARNTINIHVTCRHSRLYHSDAIAERLLNIIEGGRRLAPAVTASATPSAGTPRNTPFKVILAKAGISNPIKNFEQHLYVTFLDDRCSVWLDLAGEELYRRGQERFVNDAPLKETIAAAMIFEAQSIIQNSSNQPHHIFTQDIPFRATLFDLMAGSGTFSLEAAYMANGFIPGICRDFALKHQPAFKEATWNFLTRRENRQTPTDERQEVVTATITKIVTSDISEHAIEIIRHNVECSSLASFAPNGNSPTITPQLRDFFSYTSKEIADLCGDTSPILALNPPYGKRLDFDAPKLYTKIGRHLASLASGLRQLGKTLTVAILAPKDDTRDGTKYTCTANLLRECPALSPENNTAAKHIVTSHGGLTLNVLIAKI